MERTRLILVALLAAAALGRATAASEGRPISMDECVKLALEHNLDLQVTRYVPQLARYGLKSAYSPYDPTFRGALKHSSSSSPGSIDAQGRIYPSTDTQGDEYQLGLTGLTPWGLSYSLGSNASDTHGNRIYSQAVTNLLGQLTDLLEPINNSIAFAGLNLAQPLLKNFWIDSTRYNIMARRKDVQISELTLELQIMNTVSAVQNAYYALITASEAVRVQEQALAEAEQLYRENRKRVEVGVLAPLDEKDAESQVAASRAGLLGAQNDLVISQNTLKALITDKYSELHEMALLPTEKLAAVPQVFNAQDSWYKGLTQRPELLQARLDLEKRNIQLRYDQNQLLPQLDLTGSYGYSGSGKEFSPALDSVARGDNPSYSFGAVLSFPLENRAARYNYRSDKASREQALLSLKRLEQQIMVEIDNAIARARSSLQQVEARRQSSEFAKAAYEAEQKKLENGKSTSFQVLTYQRILTTRRYEELAALSSYNRALVDLALTEGSTLERNGIVFGMKP